MPALYMIIPAALILVALAVWIFFWAVDSGQFDDLDSPAHSILFDDTEGQPSSTGEPTAAQKELKDA